MVEVVRCDQILDRVEKWGQENLLKDWMYCVHYIYKNNAFNTASLLILGPSSLTWIFMKTIFHSSCAKMTWSLWFNNCKKTASVPHDSYLPNKKCEDYPQKGDNHKQKKLEKINWKLYIWCITLKLIIIIKASNFLYFLFP